MFSAVQFGLKTIFLILIYLFLYVLIRMIAKDLREEVVGKPVSKSSKIIKNPRLVVLESTTEKVGRTFPVAQELTIGRTPENDIFLKDIFISKQHCLICKRNGKILLQDLRSANGTFLNGERINKPQKLKLGDKIKVGQTTFKYVE
ncbi:FHA domain-containing protein [Candidatus Oleimmundimicrobium sp.]|uniref:FHA domain-containing protein n=1 Tax=Candidatus Oleimmundimicrobium sp. TaxID=3060597 RepID=UPI002724625D|nr:FHA domain-containing protein [Candidatus Oleimmundimicrobium sp.]MDO8886814.1 FHA domain-containing protein [Candidatus Oleimmundimicrobium sp.]